MQGRTPASDVDASDGATTNEATATSAAAATALRFSKPLLPRGTVRHSKGLRQVADRFCVARSCGEVRREAHAGEDQIGHGVSGDVRQCAADSGTNKCSDAPASVHQSECEALRYARTLGAARDP